MIVSAPTGGFNLRKKARGKMGRSPFILLPGESETHIEIFMTQRFLDITRMEQFLLRKQNLLKGVFLKKLEINFSYFPRSLLKMGAEFLTRHVKRHKSPEYILQCQINEL